jgi:hypothetical protein
VVEGSPGRTRARRRRPRGAVPIALALAALLALGFLAYRWLASEGTPVEPEAGETEPLAQTPPGDATEEPPPPAGPAVPDEPAEPLPTLDASDAWLRAEAGSLSTSTLLADWLANGDLVRRFVAGVDNVSEGESPRAHLPFLAPRESFRAASRGSRAVTDPRSFARFDSLAEAVASLDAERCAALYRRAKPLVEEAYRALGPGEETFDERLARAVRTLLATPVPSGEEEIVRPSVFYEYADPALESLVPVQKQLLRMGPENVRKVQGKLRELASALRIEAAR